MSNISGNATLLVMDDPASGNALLEVCPEFCRINRFANINWRCVNSIKSELFWKDVAEKAGGEASLANVVPYITSKFDNFLGNDIMRPIIAQEKIVFLISGK